MPNLFINYFLNHFADVWGIDCFIYTTSFNYRQDPLRQLMKEFPRRSNISNSILSLRF